MENLKRNPLKREKRKSDKPVQSKKKKCEGSTCSTFFSDLTRKFKIKKKSNEETIIERKAETLSAVSTKTLDIQLQKKCKSEETTIQHLEDNAKIVEDINKAQPPAMITKKEIFDNIQTKKLTSLFVNQNKIINNDLQTEINVKNIQTSKLLVESIGLPDHVEQIEPTNVTVAMAECDITSELIKHVATLRKISLIADEFNKKTARNLKEIVDSVSEDLIKKLEEVKAEQAQSPAPEKKISINLRIE